MAVEASATIVGNTTRDAELRYTSSGRAVCSFGVAVGSRRRNPQTQEWEDGDTSFFDVTAWGTLAENAAESLTKGMRVVVTGRLQQRSWENAEGEKRSKVEVVADDIGPSVRWATVEVTRVERTTADATPAGYNPSEEPFLVDVGEWQPDVYGTYPERLLP